MYISLDLESEEPIYTQLKNQIIAGIAKKEIKLGEALPSVRTLAADIGINMHTVNKAYKQLQHEGYILIHRQKGVVVNPDGIPVADEDFIFQLKKELHPLIAKSISRGVSREEFLEICMQLLNEFKEGEGGRS